MKNEKGHGSRVARQLTAEQKTRLTIWMFQNKEIVQGSIATGLSEIATKQLGFDVSPSSAQLFKLAVFPELKREPKGGKISAAKKADLIGMIQALSARVSNLERDFNCHLNLGH